MRGGILIQTKRDFQGKRTTARKFFLQHHLGPSTLLLLLNSLLSLYTTSYSLLTIMTTNKRSVSDNRPASTSKRRKTGSGTSSNELDKHKVTYPSSIEADFLSDTTGFKNISLHELINLKAAKLYEEIEVRSNEGFTNVLQTEDELRAANAIFWSTFFINQRGCPENFLVPLFNHLISKTAAFKDFDESILKACEAQFCRAHDDLLDYFVTEIDNPCLEWVKTDAVD